MSLVQTSRPNWMNLGSNLFAALSPVNLDTESLNVVSQLLLSTAKGKANSREWPQHLETKNENGKNTDATNMSYMSTSIWAQVSENDQIKLFVC